MDPSREDFSAHKYSGTFFPPVLSPHLEGFPEYEEIPLEYSSEISFKSVPCENQRPVSSLRTEANKVLNRLLKKITENDFPGKQYLAEYLRDQYRRNCRSSTLRNTHRSVELFLKFLGNVGKSRLEQMTKWEMEAFVEHEQDRGLKLSTVRTQVVTIKAFIGYLIEKAVVEHNVFPWKMQLKPPEALPKAIDPDDVNKLLRVKASARDKAMVLVLLRTGMRIGELLNTKLHDINLKERKIMIYEGLKNRRDRDVYFSDDAKNALKSWLNKRNKETQIVFYGYKGKPLSYPAARMVFVRYLKKAGLVDKEYTLHCLRHTYASELLNAGMRLECLERLMGHTSLEVTRRYARLTDKTREEEYFKAMSVIERGEINGHYKLDHQLQTIPEKAELFSFNCEELYKQP